MMELYFERKLSNFKFQLRIEILTVNRHRSGYYVVRSLSVGFILSPEIITEGESRERLFLLPNTPLGKKGTLNYFICLMFICFCLILCKHCFWFNSRMFSPSEVWHTAE